MTRGAFDSLLTSTGILRSQAGASYAVGRALAVVAKSLDWSGSDLGAQCGQHWAVVISAGALDPDVQPHPGWTVAIDEPATTLRVVRVARVGDQWHLSCIGSAAVRAR